MQAARLLTLVVALALFATAPAELCAQQGRRGGGLRVGVWNVDVAAWVTRSPVFEVYLQRGLNNDLALENSLGVWRAEVNRTKAYIVPLMTSIKFYPLSDNQNRIEPFVLGGLGFAFGIQDQDDSAIGGANSTLVTGVGLRAGAGVEVHVVRGLGISASGKYQWIHFGEEVGTMETFAGVGLEGAIVYRVAF